MVNKTKYRVLVAAWKIANYSSQVMAFLLYGGGLKQIAALSFKCLDHYGILVLFFLVFIIQQR